MTGAPARPIWSNDGLDGTQLRIDLRAVHRNWRHLRSLSGSAECAAVVKADAYGLGEDQITATLTECRTFFVATPEEGIVLRVNRPDAEIYVLSGPWSDEAARSMASARLQPVINTPLQLKRWVETGLPYALHFDTGMNRLGLPPEDAVEIARAASPLLVMSHLANADDPQDETNSRQLERFDEVRQFFPQAKLSLANSAGIFLGREYHFDLVRPGIGLYGGTAGPQMQGIERVIELSARIVQTREARSGQPVSYGGVQKVDRDSRLAVVAIGYADGYFRAGGAGVPLRAAKVEGSVAAFNGQRVPLIGRTTMDLSIFDITDIPAGTCEEGDWLEIIGETVPLDEVARRAGTISYEVLTALGPRHQRIYL